VLAQIPQYPPFEQLALKSIFVISEQSLAFKQDLGLVQLGAAVGQAKQYF
jgi:hypothetical protein